jgi:X-X-X-Leu-X-X-Gly heptad repeat protein
MDNPLVGSTGRGKNAGKKGGKPAGALKMAGKRAGNKADAPLQMSTDEARALQKMLSRQQIRGRVDDAYIDDTTEGGVLLDGGRKSMKKKLVMKKKKLVRKKGKGQLVDGAGNLVDGSGNLVDGSGYFDSDTESDTDVPDWEGKKPKKAGKSAAKSAAAKRNANTNSWIQHVKAYAAQHGVSYGEAMKAAKASYNR